jgi:alpha-L-rhamnosidase
MARHRTPYGRAECAWQLDGNEITVTAIIPPNTSAIVTLPGNEQVPFHVGSGSYSWRYAYRTPHTSKPLTLDGRVGDRSSDAAA